jgi:Tol biopolymer transport system component
MRLIILFLLISAQILIGQNVTVNNITKVMQQSQGEFYYPKFNPDGSQLLLTNANYQGLWIYDLGKKQLTQLNFYNGAGYSSVFSDDGLKIIYRADEFMGMRKYSSLIVQDIKSGNETLVEQKIRNLSVPEVLTNGQIFYTKDFNAGVFDHRANKSIDNKVEASVAYTENYKIALYSKERIELQPLGKNNYIWVSISPQQDKLLFTVPGKGTYISDLQGNILVDLGYANAPVWSPNGKYVAYMVDKDDGYQVTSSEIFVASADGKNKYQITNTSDISEMYPNWSQSGSKLTFNSTDGEIFIAELRIEKEGAGNEK